MSTTAQSTDTDLTNPGLGLSITVPQDRALINGEFVSADSGATFPVTDPTTGQVLAQVPLMGAAETRRAIDAARDAFPAWSARTAGDRSKILTRWAALLTERTWTSSPPRPAVPTARRFQPTAQIPASWSSNSRSG